MAMEIPQLLETRTQSHPRRRPANQSVCLRRTTHLPITASPLASHSSSNASSLLQQQHSSGETSNADHWFDKSNKNLASQGATYADEPPFYLDNSPHYDYDSTNLVGPSFTNKISTSSSGEYRSVIDDLTIQNQRLKEKLRRYESLHNPQMEANKLFEVKIHGLSVSKRRELEETLSRFAISLKNNGEAPSSDVDTGSSSLTTSKTPAVTKPSSSQSSIRIADSGYGSLTTSNQQNSGAPAANKEGMDHGGSSTSRNQNIQSYLSDIPNAQLSRRYPAVMTEKSKMRLVVRRLEQIFSGRGAASGMHLQHQQQQEVSHSAAQADKWAMEAQGQKYSAGGLREARMMAMEIEKPMDILGPQTTPQTLTRGDTHYLESGDDTEEQDAAGGSSGPEQRPTRPLDLDPNRAQVPEDNIEYIRHLGISLPDSVSSGIDEGGDWVYLNLLIGMAQLHDINVTPDFVKKSVMAYSAKFELSSDGRKIRWQGGEDATGSSGSDMSDGNGLNNTSHASRKRRRPHDVVDSDSSVTSKRVTKKQAHSSALLNKLLYRPIFPRKSSETDSDGGASTAGFGSDRSSHTPNAPLTSDLGQRHGVSGSKHRDDSRLIFYDNADFLADSTGDVSRILRPHRTYIDQTHQLCPLGDSPKPSSPAEVTSEQAWSRPLMLNHVPDEVVNDDDAIMLGDGLQLVVGRTTSNRVTFAEPEKPLYFEASGLGGTYPSDNLAITVVRQHHPDSRSQTARPTPSRLRAPFPNRLVPTTTKLAYGTEKILSSRLVNLPPSTLPPPSYVSDDDADSSSSTYSSLSSSQARTQPAAFTRASTSHSSSNLATTTNDDAEEEDDGTFDFLAAARVADPHAVWTREREYDAHLAERLAEEIPAGSSAATAGGGSGFCSPVDGGAGEAEGIVSS